jgi:hypothetical protein
VNVRVYVHENARAHDHDDHHGYDHDYRECGNAQLPLSHSYQSNLLSKFNSLNPA